MRRYYLGADLGDEMHAVWVSDEASEISERKGAEDNVTALQAGSSH